MRTDTLTIAGLLERVDFLQAENAELLAKVKLLEHKNERLIRDASEFAAEMSRELGRPIAHGDDHTVLERPRRQRTTDRLDEPREKMAEIVDGRLK